MELLPTVAALHLQGHLTLQVRFIIILNSMLRNQPIYLSIADSNRQSATDSADSSRQMRRINVSPPASSRSDSYTYEDSDSIDEVEATLNDLDDELDDTEQVLSSWSSSPYTRPMSATTGSYPGSPSFLSIPSALGLGRSTSPLGDSRLRLSRITERTEESSRPVSGVSHHSNTVGRTAGIASGHARSSTDPGLERDLPPPGRANQLIARFESNSPAPTGHSRQTSAPGYGRSSSPYSMSSSDTRSRSNSPTKFSTSYTGQQSATSSTFSPATYTRPSGTSTSFTPGTYTPTTFTTQHDAAVTDTDSTFTRSPPSTLRRPQTSPRSPLASVRNIVSLWKEKSPTKPVGGRSVANPPSPTTRAGPSARAGPEGGLFGIRRSASARLRAQSRGSEDGPDVPDNASNSSMGNPGNLGLDLGELSRFVGGGNGSETVRLFAFPLLEPFSSFLRSRCILGRYTI